MREILITSTVLIAALLVLRWVFRRTLSRRVQYALWALVLVRLLVPVSLPGADFSVLTAVGSQEETAVVSLAGQAEPTQSDGGGSTPQPSQQSPAGQGQAVPSGQGGTVAANPVEKPVLPQILKGIWAVGMLLVGGFFLLSNLGFWRRLCREREFYPVAGFSRRVYLIREGEGRSPFLFGLVRPAVYLMPTVAVSSSETLRHVLVHEDTHARHLDPLWALLRCVCLTIYWFDPLVWVAAACAKTDCELACDEGALARLGEDQRIPYGQTILSLIPVGKGPGNPFLTASTMAARKRQMEDRITRIAQGPRQVLAAAVAVVLLMAGVSACTFTGGADIGGLTALTGEELQFFNEVYFNGDEYNIRNQFLSSTYETPQDIDLYELFYCEGSDPSDEEIRTVLGTAPDNLVCPAFKITTGEMDQILTEYMGLTLEETNKTSLRFDYDAASDAYYHMHGDTNYRSYVFFPVGTRDGKEVKLYYQDDFMGDGWKCLTLQDQGGGNYHFVSNLPCAKPSISTDYPDETPDMTLPLTELQPYEAPVVSTEPHVGDYVTFLENWDFDGHYVQTYRATDGAIYAAVVAGDETRYVFQSGLSEDHSMFFFQDLFGYDGFFLRYGGELPAEYGGNRGIVTDFYYFSEDDMPALLARCYGSQEPRIADLDGDGNNELLTDCQIFFQRAGSVREARLPELLQGAWPEGMNWGSSEWNPYDKCLRIRAAEGQAGKAWTCDLYFDGDNLLLYADPV